MKYICFFLLALLGACAPGVLSTVTLRQAALPENAPILVLQQEDGFTNDGIEIGTIASHDNGFSVNCSYNEVIEPLKRLARSKGANVIKITTRKKPDQWSTCERIKATIYKVPDIARHEKEIEWSAGRKLSWSDFKGVPRSASMTGLAAETHCGLSMESNRVTVFKSPKLFVKNVFDCNASWVDRERMSDDLLAHEQAHFDLTEVYRRSMRKKFTEANFTVNNLSQSASLIFQEISDACNKRQAQYDDDTSHSLNRAKQKEWELKINNELRELEAYR